MKLQHKIAGTILLPLAAAAMSTTAHAELSVNGFVAGQFSMTEDAAKDNDAVGSASISRIGFKKTQLGSSNATVLVEGDFFAGRETSRAPSPAGTLRMRHAVVMVDGWSVGQTWSSAANLNGIVPTIDFVGLTLGSSYADRTAQIAYTMDLGGSKLKLGLEDWKKGVKGTDGPNVPDLAAGFSTKMGGLSVFAGGALVNENDSTGENSNWVHLTASAKMAVSESLKVTGAFTSSGNDDTDKDWTAFSGGVSLGLGGGLSANAMAEVKSYGASGAEDETSMFVNAFYKMPSGLEFGAELQTVADAGGAKGADITNINFQGKFAF